MVENVGRKLLWIALLLLGSILLVVVPSEPFRLGLDLQGGTRLLYKIDFERALELGEITREEYDNRQQLLQDTLDIIRERVDPAGTLEASFRPQDLDHFVIEIPRTASLPTVDASSTLAEELRAGETVLTLASTSEEALRGFSSTGGVIGIGEERIRYGSRSGSQLFDLRRGHAATRDSTHPQGSRVVLMSDDAIKQAIENPGSLHFYLGATTTDYPAGTDAQTELRKVTEWLEKNPRLPITAYNRLPFPEGPPENIKWFPHRLRAGQDPSTPMVARLEALVQSANPDWRFDGLDLKTVHTTRDDFGYPAVGLEMTTEASFRFGEFTERFQESSLAVVVNDEIVTLATIEEPLRSRFQIRGGRPGFTESEVLSMVKVLRSGSFKIKPDLESEERVGASLGDHYVRSGAISSVLAIVVVLGFMVFFYRRLGVYAALSMLCNLVLLMGAMAFLKATLTLPGVAGIILTVGMAVDANILIYERIREESQKGRKLAQAAKEGFEKALSAIVDSNVTTFLTAAILFRVGTGPVRGFATTLMIGILTSMFSALVITRLLVHFSIQRGATTFKAIELLKNTHIAFMSMARKAVTVSALLILTSVGLFISVPEKEKFSIDFLGGFTLTVRTEEPQPTQAIRERISKIPGTIGKADVAAILDSGNKNDGYRQFRITFKADPAEASDASAAALADAGEKTGEAEIRDALADVLQRGPVTVSVDEVARTASGRLYFEETHPETDVVGVLAEAGLAEVRVSPDAGHPGVYGFEARFDARTTERELLGVLTRIFAEPNRADSRGAPYSLAQPLPQSAVVGAQVVGQLRDKAIAAILLSLAVIILYIRFRFAEYSYGIAAVVAIVHDILFVLGMLAIADYTNFIDGEISLPMIAAFLTIIGYSLNDTIVIFDRVRENLPRMKGNLAEILDISINQTLSRTILTSFTTWIAVAVLLAFNYGGGSVLEGFSFALLVGILVGTYSTVFIACPVFLWLEERARRKEAATAAVGA